MLNGTLQTDIFKEYIAQKEWLFPPEPHLRLIGDLMEYCVEQHPGVQAAVGLRLPHPRGRLDRRAGAGVHPRRRLRLRRARARPAAWTSTSSRPGLSFFFDAHLDFFEEIAKFRAARRIWARWLRDVYGAKTDKAQWLRFHTQTAGVSLTAQQPDNNIVRTAVEALAAVLGGTNSLHTNALDEVLALPSEKAAEIALRTQQVIMEETGVANVADPLGGSWYVEALTDRIEAEAEAVFSPDPGHGLATASMTSGILRGIEDGWFMSEIAEAAFAYQTRAGEGREEDRRRQLPHHDRRGAAGDPAGLPRGRARAEARARRAPGRPATTPPCDAALARMVEVARTDANMVPAMLDAVRAEATLGEICDALRGRVGRLPRAAALLAARPAMITVP